MIIRTKLHITQSVFWECQQKLENQIGVRARKGVQCDCIIIDLALKMY